ncbi:MAG: hypothetical protein WCO35_00510 [Candidatus Nomurabacteria bacterium]
MIKYPFLEKSQIIKKEAKTILDSTNIVDFLNKFGEVNLIGSYAYDVMMSKDIDFHIIVKEFDMNIIKTSINYFLDSGLFEYIEFHDKHNFNEDAATRYTSKKALDSFYLGLKMTFNESLWQIGINFIIKSQESSNEIIELMKNSSDEEKEKILEFKHLLFESDIKVSSSYIYLAVIEKKAKTKEELFEYLKSIGYSV